MSPLTTLELAQKIRDLEEEIGELSPLQKALLGTDGSVTNFLEMVTGSPVEITTLTQEVIDADPETARTLSIEPGEKINYRVVELKESRTGDVLVYAVSQTPLKRLAPDFREDLMRADIPIGRILQKYRIESRREIQDIRMLRADPRTSRIFSVHRHEPLLSRRYRIIHRDAPLIAIEEIFPGSRFAETERVIVDAPARLHLALIDMNGSLGRVDGGIGIALDSPAILLEARRSPVVTARGGDEESRQRVRQAARAVLESLKIAGGVELLLHSTVRHHAGLGSGTSLALAAARAVCELYERSVPVRELARIVGRGGTSGIGTAAFEMGGFILDGGHSFGKTGGKQDFRPSSASREIGPAPVTARHPFPEDWKILIVTPEIPAGANGSTEADIFRANCPVPIHDVREICHEVLVRMIPGLVEQDLDLFGSAVNRIQHLGFKKVELGMQSPFVSGLIEGLSGAGAACAGMSSFGPTVYAVTDTGMHELACAARELIAETGGEVLTSCGRNCGARIRAV